jgi:hypothetical protein
MQCSPSEELDPKKLLTSYNLASFSHLLSLKILVLHFHFFLSFTLLPILFAILPCGILIAKTKGRDVDEGVSVKNSKDPEILSVRLVLPIR